MALAATLADYKEKSIIRACKHMASLAAIFVVPVLWSRKNDLQCRTIGL